jgi:PDZ domain-containing protein
MHETIPPSAGSWRFLRRFLVIGVAVAVLVVALGAWSTNEYAITPGNATNVAPLVTIKGLATDPHRDRIMLVDVYLQPLSELQFLLMHFHSHVEFVTGSQLLAPGIPTSQLIAQGFLQMSDSQTAAKVAALRALGWKVPARPSGTVVTGVVNNTPASRAGLRVGDEITGINGHAVTSRCALVAALAHVAVGAKVTMTLRAGRFSATGVLRRARVSTVALTTARSPNPPTAVTGCVQSPHGGASWLGIALEDGVRYTFPGAITLNTANIGGPSAGLAMTLTLIDALSRGSLTGGHVIATTGTIDPQGNVGDVGGVAQKTIAVENAGIHYFFVPQVEVATARAVAAASLHVIGVRTLAQVLRDLRKLGGAAPVALSAARKP